MRTRSPLVHAVALVAVAVVTGVSALPASAADLHPEVEAVREQLAPVEARSEEARAAVGVAKAAIAAAEGGRALATAALEDAAQALSDAVADRQLADRRAEEALQEATSRTRTLEQAVERVVAVADLRDRQSGDLRALAVEAWKNGGDTAKAVGVVDALLTAQDVGGYLGAVERLGFGADRTRDLVAETTAVLERDMKARDRAARRAASARELARRAEQIVVERLDVEAARRTAAERAQAELERAEEAVSAAQASLVAADGALEAAEAEAEAVRASAGRVSHLGGMPGPGRLAWPTDGRVTSGFGSRMHPIHREVRQHAGIDIPGPTGQPILAAAAGRVLAAGERSGYGLTVDIDHGDGLSTRYAHLSSIGVTVGQQVEEAERIGALGSTGQSTGPHLHFEVHVGGKATDPLAHFLP